MESGFLQAGAPVVSVSQLVRSAREAIERSVPLLWVGGEISNLRTVASGHRYFVLKDALAQVDCVMFRSRAAYLDWEPKDGMRVEVRALASIYEPRGRFQLNVEAMRQAGRGPLYERFLQLKERLEREGLFDPAAKRLLPAHPRCIGVVTSLGAAALRDVLTTLRRRNSSIPVIVYPAPVQGEGAARRLALSIETANARAECDVLLLVRGGGSIEDLWQFNEEVLARAVRASGIPVVTGVGHDTDFTIADFAADARAPTPTAAAELVSPPLAELRARVTELAQRASREARRKLEYGIQSLDLLARRLVHPAERLRGARQLLAQLAVRLSSAAAHRVELAHQRLSAARPRLAVALARRLQGAAAQLDMLRASLQSLDPTAVLARGYSITRDAGGAVVKDATALRDGERLTTTLARGWVESEVRRTGSP